MKINKHLLFLSGKLAETQVVLNSVLSGNTVLTEKDLEKKLAELISTICILDQQETVNIECMQKISTMILPAIYTEVTGLPMVSFSSPEEIRSTFRVLKCQ